MHHTAENFQGRIRKRARKTCWVGKEKISKLCKSCILLNNFPFFQDECTGTKETHKYCSDRGSVCLYSQLHTHMPLCVRVNVSEREVRWGKQRMSNVNERRCEHGPQQ